VNFQAEKSTVNALGDSTDMYSGHIYQGWDSGKIMICRCDMGYKGADCSRREIPRGDDPLTVVKALSMKQGIQISGMTGGEFFVKYHDPYGGIWKTQTVGNLGTGSNADDAIVAAAVQAELRTLPNQVMDKVSVSAIAAGTTKPTCHRFYDGVQHFSSHDQTRAGSSHNSKYIPNYCLESDYDGFAATTTTIDLQVEFGGSSGQSGVQYLLEVDVAAHGAGSFPVSAGVAGTSVSVTIAEINYNDNLGNLSELSDCSDRGLDDGMGLCECFDGYSGLACEQQVALV
jgi:hypothetical protein